MQVRKLVSDGEFWFRAEQVALVTEAKVCWLPWSPLTPEPRIPLNSETPLPLDDR